MSTPKRRRSYERFNGMPDDLEFQKNLYTMVGHSVVAFSLLDFGLDMLAGMIFRDFGGNTVRRKFPMPFSERIQFISECSRLAPLARYKTELTSIVDEAERVAAIRNDIMHGYPADYRKSRNHLLTFAKAVVDKATRIQAVALRRITAQDLMQAGSDTSDLSLRVAGLNIKLAQKIDRQERKMRPPTPKGRRTQIGRRAV